jgi:hypothetical protein
MDIQKIRSLVWDVVWFEAYEQDPELREQMLSINIDDTTDAVLEYVINMPGLLEKLEGMETWMAEEYVHVVALDYFSSYEAVFSALEVA